jgi:hypothetical protein
MDVNAAPARTVPSGRLASAPIATGLRCVIAVLIVLAGTSDTSAAMAEHPRWVGLNLPI